MLQDFPAETATPGVKKEPPKLEGFYSEKARALDKLLALDKAQAAKHAAASQLAINGLRSQPAADRLPTSQLAIAGMRKSSLALHGLRESRLAIDRSMEWAAPVLTVLAAIALAVVAIATWRAAPVTAPVQVARESTDVAVPAAERRESTSPVQPRAEPQAEAERRAQVEAAAETHTATSQLPVASELNVPAPRSLPATPAAVTAAATAAAKPNPTEPVRVSSVGNFAEQEAQPVATSLQARLGVPVEEPAPVQTLQPPRVSTAGAAAATIRQPIELPAERLEAAPIVTAQRPADPTPAIRDVIRRYEAAYEHLDASAAKEIWPSLDERALARAFSGLASQTLRLEPCNIDVSGTSAVASCHGMATYVGRVGNKMNQVQRRDWRFELRKTTDDWQIRSVRSN